MKGQQLEGWCRAAATCSATSGTRTRTSRSSRPSWRPEIIKVLDREGLSVRAAQARTGITAADFSRIRNADLGRFTVDRLMSIINRLGSRVEMTVTVRRTKQAEHGVPA